MIRRSIHTFATPVAGADRNDLRQGFVSSAAMCLDLGKWNYQPETTGMTRSEQPD